MPHEPMIFLSIFSSWLYSKFGRENSAMPIFRFNQRKDLHMKRTLWNFYALVTYEVQDSFENKKVPMLNKCVKCWVCDMYISLKPYSLLRGPTFVF